MSDEIAITFPEVIDSTMMADWRSCRHQFWRKHLQHWKPRVPSVHLHAGAAYASGLEAARKAFFDEGKTQDEATAIGLAALIAHYGDFECPPDSAKSLERTAGALEFYMDQYPLEQETAKPYILPSGKHAIEFSFAEPVDFNHPVTGNPILYAGRFDTLVDFAGAQYGEDDKTTTQLGASWPEQWHLRGQFTSYCWGAGRAGIPLAGFLLRGVSILKTKYDTLQAITYRAPWQIEEWYEALLQELADMRQAWEQQTWRKVFGDACNAYGGCEFRQICQSADPQPWLDASFERRRWDPLLREEKPV